MNKGTKILTQGTMTSEHDNITSTMGYKRSTNGSMTPNRAICEQHRTL